MGCVELHRFMLNFGEQCPAILSFFFSALLCCVGLL
jgi:hypothetical protein